MSNFKSKTLTIAMQKLCHELGEEYQITFDSMLNDFFICKKLRNNYRVLIGCLEPRYKGDSASIYLVCDDDKNSPCGFSIKSIDNDIKFCDIAKQVDKITRKIMPKLL